MCLVSLQFGNSPHQLQQQMLNQQAMQMGIRPMSLNINGMMQQQPVLREEEAVAAAQTVPLYQLASTRLTNIQDNNLYVSVKQRQVEDENSSHAFFNGHTMEAIPIKITTRTIITYRKEAIN